MGSLGRDAERWIKLRADEGPAVLPTKSLDLYTLHDASYEKSYSYISGQLTPPLPPDADPALPPPSSAASSIDPAVLKEILVGLGGRLTDMDLLAQKIKAASMVAGENGKMPEITTELVRDCYEDLVTRVIAEVRKAGFGDTPDEAAKMGWTPVQFWFLVKRLAANDSVSYDEVKNSVPFGRKDAPLFAMEDAELISLEYERGRPFRIRVGRPIARIAFREMVGGDPRFAAGMSVRECEEAIQSIVEKQIVPAEEELARLQAIVSGTGQGGGLMGYLGLKERRGLQERVGQLSSAIGGATAQIEKLNEEKGKWKSLM